MSETADALTFSIIIPAFNEEDDIAQTIETCLAIDYPHKEIIVVDDSTDDTPRIVEGYANRGVRLIHRKENRNGCCGARNVGMQHATGDVVVIVNGDVRPRPNFLQGLAEHYENGADWVVCYSNVVNPDNIWSIYIYAWELLRRGHTDPWWCEGFSCRREAAEAVGYIPGDFPVRFCRDNLLGASLAKAGYVKHMASEILTDHVAHNTLEEFWSVRVARGSWSAIYFLFFQVYSPPVIAARELLKVVGRLVLAVTLVHPLWWALRMSPVVGWRYFAGLFGATLVYDLAYSVGGLKGLRMMLDQLRKKGVEAPA